RAGGGEPAPPRAVHQPRRSDGAGGEPVRGDAAGDRFDRAGGAVRDARPLALQGGGGLTVGETSGGERMLQSDLISAALHHTVDSFPERSGRRQFSGKVREVFELVGDRLAIAVTDRISVFDFVIGSVPFKGQVLNQLAAWWLRKLDDIGVPHHLVSVPHPNVSIVRRAQALPIEIVVRGYLTGSTKTSSWDAYQHHHREISGITMPAGMKKNEAFPAPIITPSTKPTIGHDVNISRREILQQGLTTQRFLDAAEDYALRMFAHGQALAARRG